jgi:hypothetical protein
VTFPEPVVFAGDDHSHAKAEVGQAIHDLVDERYVRGIVRDDYDELLATLQAEHARLSALPPEPDEVKALPTGIAVAARWATLDQEGKRSWLRKWEVQLDARHTDDDTPPWPRADTMTFVGNGLRIKVSLVDPELRDAAVQDLA